MSADPEAELTTPEPPRRRVGPVRSFLGWVLIVLAVAVVVVGIVAAAAQR